MTEPQYYWQSQEHRGGPIHDLPEEEFIRRLEELIDYLACLEQVDVVS